MKNKFPLGCIVTFKSHPLLYDYMIKGDGKLVPPFMIVKEVFIENKKKKVVDENMDEIIAEHIKYVCVFFDDNKNEFKEVSIYESMLVDYTNIFIKRFDEGNPKELKKDGYKSLIEETLNDTTPEYIYGNLVYFKTKKFEVFKKRSSIKTTKLLVDNKVEKNEPLINEFERKETIQYVVNYSSPDFVLCGIKKNELISDFYSKGVKRKVVSEVLFKVKWFNSSQMKFSEVYLPAECFTSIQPFKTKIKHNKKEGKE
jgi:hypothetical protein